uniref:HINTW n=1 Tax=Gallus gallus TaxID=9031 RepID=A0A8V0X6R3_CHICK
APTRAEPCRAEASRARAEPSRAEPCGGGLGLRECCSERAPSWPAGSLGRRPPGAVAPLSWEKSPARSSPPTLSARRSRCGRGAAPQKAVVRLSGAEDCGAPLLGRLMIDGEKCAANLGLTNGFRMAVRYPPSAPSDYRARLCILGGRQLGRPPG